MSYGTVVDGYDAEIANEIKLYSFIGYDAEIANEIKLYSFIGYYILIPHNSTVTAATTAIIPFDRLY